MSRQQRIEALFRFGFTPRQAAFLDTVLHHSGVCLPRQFAAFAGIAYGHKTNRFFDRLVSRGYASVCPCLHNRALVYHVRHRPLYSAIGQPQSRLRRPVPAASVMPRLMLLDAVLEARDVRRNHGLGRPDVGRHAGWNNRALPEMRDRLGNPTDAGHGPFVPGTNETVLVPNDASMLIEIDGCVFDRDELQHSHGFAELDPVGRESFVNHIHLQGPDSVRQAEAIVSAWSRELRDRWPRCRFRVYLDKGSGETTIHFHMVRDGIANWAESGAEIIEVGE